jgi:serine/threonine-protein kinase
MQRIQLPKGVFELDPDKPLGKRGGFGQVFCGQSPTNGNLAIKRLYVSAVDAAHRELRIAEELSGRSFQNVIPFIDSGEDPDSGSYFIVMPRAEKSLQDLIDSEPPRSPAEAAVIMLQILSGLLEVPELIHRDLKPANVLFHENKWKVADFGIAKFVEESIRLEGQRLTLDVHSFA